MLASGQHSCPLPSPQPASPGETARWPGAAHTSSRARLLSFASSPQKTPRSSSYLWAQLLLLPQPPKSLPVALPSPSHPPMLPIAPCPPVTPSQPSAALNPAVPTPIAPCTPIPQPLQPRLPPYPPPAFPAPQPSRLPSLSRCRSPSLPAPALLCSVPLPSCRGSVSVLPGPLRRAAAVRGGPGCGSAAA